MSEAPPPLPPPSGPPGKANKGKSRKGKKEAVPAEPEKKKAPPPTDDLEADPTEYREHGSLFIFPAGHELRVDLEKKVTQNKKFNDMITGTSVCPQLLFALNFCLP